MDVQHDYLALDWLKDEIEATLEQAKTALQAYIDDSSDDSQLRFCLTHLHQVHGTLQMVEFYGIALLTSEMELLATALLDNEINDDQIATAQQSLINAIDVLPAYIASIQAEQRDTPHTLLPLLNDLRAARGAQKLADSAVFKIEIEKNLVYGDVPEAFANHPKFSELTQRLRHRYQTLLLQVVRRKATSEHFAQLKKLFIQLETISGKAVTHPLWKAITALMELLAQQPDLVSSDLVMLLNEVDKQLKFFNDQGVDFLTKTPAEGLLRNVLFFLAKQKSTSQRFNELRQQFEFSDDFAATDAAPEPSKGSLDEENLTAVVQILMHELDKSIAVITDAMTADTPNKEELGQQGDILKQLADTLSMMGLGLFQQQIETEQARLTAIAQGEHEFDAEQIQQSVKALQDVHQQLDSVKQDILAQKNAPDQLEQSRKAVFNECRSGIEQAKQGIVDYIAFQWNEEYLKPLPSFLIDIFQVLYTLGLTDAAEVIEQSVAFIETLLAQNENTPHWQQLDALADALTSVDYYLERLADRDNSQSQELIALAQQSVTIFSADVDDVKDAQEELASTTEEAVEDAQQVTAPAVEIDDDIIDIFIEEATDVLQTLNEYTPQWLADNDNEQALAEMRRAYHTLKGSGRMVGASVVSEFAWASENILNQLLDKTLLPSENVVNAIHIAYHVTPELVAAFSEKQEPAFSVAELEQKFHAVAANQTVELPLDLIEQPATETQEELPEGVDRTLVEIFRQESQNNLNVISSWLQEVVESDAPVALSNAVHRALHTIKGSARMADIEPIAEIVEPAESMVKSMINHGEKANYEFVQLLQDITAILLQASQRAYPGMARLQQAKTVLERLQTVYADIKRQRDSAGQEKLNAFLTSTMADIASAEDHLVAWFDASAEEDLAVAITDLTRIGQLAEPVNLKDVVQLITPLVAVLERLQKQTLVINEQRQTLLEQALEAIMVMVDCLTAGIVLKPATQEISALHELLLQQDEADTSITTRPEIVDKDEPVVEEPAVPQPAPVAKKLTPVASGPKAQPLDDSMDLDLLAIFIEEADEILADMSEQLFSWQNNPEDAHYVQLLQRSLHTLKGGARMAGITPLGNLSHYLEDLFDALVAGTIQVNGGLFDLLNACQDRIAVMVSDLRNETMPLMANELSEAIKRFLTSPNDFVFTVVPTEDSVENVSEIVAEQDFADMHISQKPVVVRQETDKQAAEEMVRIGSGLLEKLVNLAGESSINRGRIEEQLNDFLLQIEEMGITISRLYDQLRRLDGETEAQILANYQHEIAESRRAGNNGFDPLEMDQYSELNQITRQLFESASDLLDLKTTLVDKIRDTETVLLQQGRINTELQEKLMQTRMVSFSRIVPRLRRIVRQEAANLGKQVNFTIQNVESEMDRTLLERAIIPLEHMLRNAVDHGIEEEQERKNKHKPAKGNIILDISREGNEILLTLEDDGGGLNIDAIRKKAIEQNLITSTAKLTDQEVIQFLFQAGFSTAEKITQVSGRGVGLDVVAAEIKQMGGSVAVTTSAGQGTKFNVRLPFSLAVSSTLMVEVQDTQYAIPLNQIEGIVRISTEHLARYMHANPPPFVYAKQQYDFKYLGELVDGTGLQELNTNASSLPVLLIRSTDNTTALLIDELMGSHEAVIKPLGLQLSKVPGLNGATILGDGEVIVVLDIHSLIRAMQVKRQGVVAKQAQAEPAKRASTRSTAPLVMVVDDSVTVRRVTSRLLERQGYQVVTAKDGLDAVAKLEDYSPDIMLLDIEMPRMDGYEVALHVRRDDKTKALPIIMITSRTGEKHRQKAFELGVNEYLGKPFQEEALLNSIGQLLT